jgi:Flp pilus assembly protein TadD
MISDDYHTARDALRKYVEVQPLDSAGHNMYGLALESIGLLKAAEREFAHAITLINREIETPEKSSS